MLTCVDRPPLLPKLTDLRMSRITYGYASRVKLGPLSREIFIIKRGILRNNGVSLWVLIDSADFEVVCETPSACGPSRLQGGHLDLTRALSFA